MSYIPIAAESAASASRLRPSLQQELEHIQSRDSSLQAWAYLPSTIDTPRCADRPPRLLEGLPFGVKDVLDVRGMPTRCGSVYLDDLPAARDAACVATLRSAGAIPIGKTQTAEFAYRQPPLTNNPAAPGHTPGGSSSGSAAAVAAQMVPFALSTQTGGSIIRPAAYCGTFGFKPSFGLVSRSGLAPGCESLDTIGWHAKDLDMADRVAQVLLGQHDAAGQLVAPARSLKVLQIHAPGEEAPQDEVSSNLRQACQALQSHGWTILDQTEAHSAMLRSFLEAHKVIMTYELCRSLRPVVIHHPAVSRPVAELLHAGQSICRSEYTKALVLQARQRLSWDAFTSGADIILAPSAPSPPAEGLRQSGSSAYCRAWTFLGWPCLHLPLGVSRTGLPLGFQIITPWQTDSEAFRAAKLIWQACSHEHSS